MRGRTFKRVLIAVGLGIVAYLSAVILLVIYNGQKIGEAGLAVTLALTRPFVFLTGRAPPRPTCDGCAVLPSGSRVLLGTDTIAVLWELRGPRRTSAPDEGELLVRGAFVPGGARATPIDSAVVALIPRAPIVARDTVVLEMISRDSALRRGLEPRGHLFTDAPDMRAYTIFW